MRAMRGSDKITLSSTQTQVLLRELYDKEFGIANHELDPNPLSLVSMHSKELHQPYSREERLHRRFVALKVNEKFGISITEFLNCSRDKVEMMLRIAEESNSSADNQERDIKKQLDDLEKRK